MLGSGFIGRFYADSLQGQRSKDKIVMIYSRREEAAKQFAKDYQCEHITTDMEAAIAHPDVDVVCISLPNNLHEPAVMLCCKHNKAVITTKPLGRNAAEAKRMLEAVEAAGEDALALGTREARLALERRCLDTPEVRPVLVLVQDAAIRLTRVHHRQLDLAHAGSPCWCGW